MSTHVKDHSPGFLAIVHEAKTRVKEIDIEQYKAMRKNGIPHLLIDVREEREWNEEHAAGAIHLSKGIIERDIEVTVPDQEATLVLYCGGGYRSALASDNLMKMGYANVISLDGGWRAIEVSGLPLEKGSNA
jgi:rhodanese-related sulfurtransferase